MCTKWAHFLPVLLWAPIEPFSHEDAPLSWLYNSFSFIDKRFPVQARITGALQISLNVAKQNPQNFKVLHPVLQVLKIYAGSRKYSLFLHDSELFANFNERFQKLFLSEKTFQILTQLFCFNSEVYIYFHTGWPKKWPNAMRYRRKMSGLWKCFKRCAVAKD